MNKKVLTLAIALLLTAPAMAQIFLDDESMTNYGWLGDMDELGNIVPFQEVTRVKSNFAPTGSGILLLTVLGGAYLFGKRHKEE